MKLSYTFLATALLIGAGQSAFADGAETSQEWKSHDYFVEFSGSAVKKKARNFQFISETIYTDQNAEAGNVALTCLNEVLTVMVAYKPLDMEDFVLNDRKTRRWKTRKAEIKIDGDLQKMNDWTYLPKYGVAISRKRSDGAKIYNSAIKGRTVTIGFDFKKPVELVLPKPNTDFAEFGAPCGMGKFRDQPYKIGIDKSEVNDMSVRTSDVSDPN